MIAKAQEFAIFIGKVALANLVLKGGEKAAKYGYETIKSFFGEDKPKRKSSKAKSKSKAKAKGKGKTAKSTTKAGKAKAKGKTARKSTKRTRKAAA